MLKRCKHCNQEFEKEKRNQVFCKDACRINYWSYRHHKEYFKNKKKYIKKKIDYGLKFRCQSCGYEISIDKWTPNIECKKCKEKAEF